MFWINENKTIWRMIILFLLLIAFIGPWTYEQIHVPAQYECTPPNFRLEGDFCGTPLSGMWIFATLLGMLIGTVVRMVTGADAFANVVREFSLGVFILLVLLPVFSTLLLFSPRHRQHRQVFHVAAWRLAVISSWRWLLTASTSAPPSIQLWGFWFYIGLAFPALILEIMVLVSKRRVGLSEMAGG